MILSEILRAKGHIVHTIPSHATLDEVVQTLVRFNCGSLVVCDGEFGASGAMLGIITERDILKVCAAHGGSLANLLVSDAMTVEITTASPNDSVEDTMGLMTEHRIRHLPIVENGRLVGIVSIGDVVKVQHDQLTMENHYLKSYIHG